MTYLGLKIAATSIQNVRKLTDELHQVGRSLGVLTRNVEVNRNGLGIRFFQSARRIWSVTCGGGASQYDSR